MIGRNILVALAVLGIVVNIEGEEPPKEDCYGVLGCFSSDPPWYSSEHRPVPAPAKPEDIATRFYLYTSKDSNKSFNISSSDTEFNVSGTGYDGAKETYFITHGLAGSSTNRWVSELRDAILRKYEGNVILVDWTKGAVFVQPTHYFKAVSNTRVVGATLAILGKYLISQGAAASRFTLIGFSLGAHVSAYMGKALPGIGKLYALDPAQQLFQGFDEVVRLVKKDADYVQVVHTNGGRYSLSSFWNNFGMGETCGHVDFYMNGGQYQPVCDPGTLSLSALIDSTGIDTQLYSKSGHSFTVACSHHMAVVYFTLSILNSNCTFWGYSISADEIVKSLNESAKFPHHKITENDCNATSCLPIGFEARNYPGRGAFYVETTKETPYCIPQPSIDSKMAPYRNSSSE